MHFTSGIQVFIIHKSFDVKHTLTQLYCKCNCRSLLKNVYHSVILVMDIKMKITDLFLPVFSSEEWKKVSKSEREKIGVTVQDDGEFW